MKCLRSVQCSRPMVMVNIIVVWCSNNKKLRAIVLRCHVLFHPDEIPWFFHDYFFFFKFHDMIFPWYFPFFSNSMIFPYLEFLLPMVIFQVFQCPWLPWIRYHAFLHKLTCYGSCTLMCHTGQFNEHIRLFETLYRGKLKGYHCNSRWYTCIYMYIHYKYVVSSHIRTFIWHHDIWPLSTGIMESFESSHLRSHFTLDMDHIEICGYFSNDKDMDM